MSVPNQVQWRQRLRDQQALPSATGQPIKVKKQVAAQQPAKPVKPVRVLPPSAINMAVTSSDGPMPAVELDAEGKPKTLAQRLREKGVVVSNKPAKPSKQPKQAGTVTDPAAGTGIQSSLPPAVPGQVPGDELWK